MPELIFSIKALESIGLVDDVHQVSGFGYTPEYPADAGNPLPVVRGVQQVQFPDISMIHLASTGGNPAVGEKRADQMVGIKIAGELSFKTRKKLLANIG